MKILMFGWEFPPFNAGGLGTACHGLTKGLKNHDVDVTFVIPKMVGDFDPNNTHVNLLISNSLFLDSEEYEGLKVEIVDSMLAEYIDPDAYDEKISSFRERIKTLRYDPKSSNEDFYGGNLHEEVYRYSEKARVIALMDDYDLIHAHDWMTYEAGIKAKEATGKPLVVHIHATEFDRTCGHPNQYIYDLERKGFHVADKIIAVSQLTKNKVVEHYGIPPEKVDVVHNGVEFKGMSTEFEEFSSDSKTVLYLGRMTMQKGPEYFINAAKKVIDYDSDVKFVMAGGGDMEGYLVHRVAELGMAKNFMFTGFLRGKEIDQAYKMSNVFVMPSVSEPFGITPLEAIRNKTPCIISKSSGVSEVLDHCLKVDFWDIDMMSNMMIAALNFGNLNESLSDNAISDIGKFDWTKSASKCVSVYRNVLDDYYPNK